MSQRREFRDSETVVVSITPLAVGVTAPALVTALTLAAAVMIGRTWEWPRAHAWLLVLAVLVPSVVLAGRLGRWRSHTIVVTTERVMEVGGVLRRRRGTVEIADVVAIRVDQGLFERLTRRGRVGLDMGSTTVLLERVRRPDALARVIDHQRGERHSRPDPTSSRDVEEPGEIDESLLFDERDAQRWRHLFGPDGPRA